MTAVWRGGVAFHGAGHAEGAVGVPTASSFPAAGPGRRCGVRGHTPPVPDTATSPRAVPTLRTRPHVRPRLPAHAPHRAAAAGPVAAPARRGRQRRSLCPVSAPAARTERLCPHTAFPLPFSFLVLRFMSIKNSYFRL